MATLHHQLVYRLQNHALDLPTPQTTSDALMILADSSESIPSIVQIPRQIQKQELLKLMPLEWLSNYEKFHQNSQPVQTTNAHFEKRADGTVKLTFQSPSTSQTPIVSHPPSEQSTPRNSFSYSSMIIVVSTTQENLPIHGFALDGYPIYPDKINGNFLRDVPGSHMCDPDCPCLEEEDNDDDFNRRPRQRKKKSHKLDPCHKKPHLPPDDPDSLMPLPIYRKGLRLIQKENKQRLCRQETTLLSSHAMPVQPCMMFSSSSYQKQAQNSAFRSLNEKIKKVAFQVKQTYTKEDKITSQLERMYLDMQNRVTQFDSDLRFMIQNIYWGPEFNKKEAEIRHTYQPFYKPSTSRQLVDYAKFFGLSHLKHAPTPTPPKPRSKPPKPEPPPTYHQPSDPQSSPEPQFIQKNTEPMHQYSSQVLPHISESEETSTDEESFSLESYSSSSNYEESFTDISKLLMVQPSTGSNDPSPSSPPQTPIVEEADFDTNPTPHQENSSSKPSNGPWFTFDDIPRVKWPARFQDFSAWIDVQMLRIGATPQTVLKEFSSRVTGSLRDWFESLGPYRQLQVIQAQISEVLGIIYEQFLGEATAANEQTRRKFHLIK
ncbi:hypothetical protein KPL71_023881 [Citrus sinensis]|uniref:Uncharacterized protein n=1 Tax=Citrus sinensis TaxID=2711 RepID=A0ACB8ILY4_CITSI|nr:hypothetical protein KPL71_023881 [Citrus sinensis]